ncbi:hypothetical protein [Limosilactobacillus fermentum]
MVQKSGVEAGLNGWSSAAQPVRVKFPAESLINGVREVYDIVVLDVPPMLQVTDTQALSSNLDGVILVVRQGVTRKRQPFAGRWKC